MLTEISDLQAELVLVEDDPDDRFMIARALHRLRPQLRLAMVRDGVELIDHLSQRRPGCLPRLVLLDLNMPRMDGGEVLAWVKADAAFRDLAIVVLSTSVEAQDRERTRALNAAGFISKPDGIGQLIELLEGLLDQYLGPSVVMRT